MNGWQPVIGLEVHARLLTRSKLFSGASASYGAAPNSQACAVDLGLPGVLPVLNREAVRMAVRFGIAVGARVATRCVFARKNYFYPDLPKGYQISQYDDPITSGGSIRVACEGFLRDIGLVRAHLEEDAGRSVHEGFGELSGIDLNRAGTPLLEIVTEPAIHSAAEAASCMRKIHTLVRWLGICDGNMQEGSFRCDANVSVRPAGSRTLGTRTEIKNVNSFRFVERAIGYEIERQIDLIESGGAVVQETASTTRSDTRLVDAGQGRGGRLPLLPRSGPAAGHRGRGVHREGTRLPARAPRRTGRTAVERLRTRSGGRRPAREQPRGGGLLRGSGCGGGRPLRFASHRELGHRRAHGSAQPRGTANREHSGRRGRFGRLIRRIADGTISGRMGKTVFDEMWASDEEPDAIIETRGLRQVTDAGEIERLVDAVLDAHPKQVEQYLGGSEKVLGFFVGQVMKQSRGKADPRQANTALRVRLANRREEPPAG